MRSGSPAEGGGKDHSSSKDQEPQCHAGRGAPMLKIVSLGPGDGKYLSPRAKEALEEAEVVVGYSTYMGLLDPEILKGKELISTGMKKEIERCRAAVRSAEGGRATAIVCSGDAGIYGMAGLILEMIEEEGLSESVEVEVIPGIPALCAAAALLGAPLMHDFVVISLSDLLTPWELIRSRVEAGASADYVIVLYNPKSRKRDWQIDEVGEIVLKHRPPETPVGIVRNAMRENQEIHLATLGNLAGSDIDMLTIVIIGNSQTKLLGGKMVTPRGYREKYGSLRSAPKYP
ncbi:MAG: precorrin-3B C(17)-methyltransferase [Desulfobacteraceae bacterium]|nr:MAG: precorrin-3B C(17)-methyltransferase [Desulfobacteraceae bacterium]